MVRGLKKRRGQGNVKGRGGKSFDAPRPKKAFAQGAAEPLFSLQDEVFTTARGDHFWSRETRLRDKGIIFVPAGNLVRNSEQDEDEAGEIEDLEEVEELGDGAIEQSSNAIAKLTLDNECVDSTPLGAAQPSPLYFFVDTEPSVTPMTNMPSPQVRSPSPTPSDSSEEVVFRGRNAPKIATDPSWLSSSSNRLRPHSQSRTQSGSRRTATPSSAERSVALVIEEKTQIESTVPRSPSLEPTPVDWPHSSRQATKQTQPLRSRDRDNPVEQNRKLQAAAEDEAMADYIANLREQKSASDGSENLEADLVINLQESRLVPEEGNHGKSEDASDDEDVDDYDDDDDDEYDSDGDPHEDFKDEEDIIERRVARMTDEQIARLLAKQEDLGLGSDELIIFDDSDILDGAHDGLNEGDYGLPQLPAAGSRSAREHRKKKKQRDVLPSATLFADVLEQDPHNGYDIMDWERPSLRAKPKGRKFEDDIPLDLDDDDELEATLKSAWDQDRAKKRLKKAERAEIRAQGLLGRGKSGKPDLRAKYDEGMSLAEFRDELRQFLSSTHEALALPPMDKHLRKGIHEVAMEFGLKSKSRGSGKSRFPVLGKTRQTVAFDDDLWLAIQTRVDRGFFARLDRQSKGRKGKQPGGGGGASSSAVRYRDGEVVGAAAPEIGEENRGRAMLEKMGWSKGMALGTATNQGILQPVVHIVKTSKAGLG